MTLLLAGLLAGWLLGMVWGRWAARRPALQGVPVTAEGEATRSRLLSTIQVLMKMQGYEPTEVFPSRSDGYDTGPDSDWRARQQAIGAGLRIIEGSKHTLLLDLDDGKAIDPEVLGELTTHFGDFTIETWTSKSGQGTHAILTFPHSKFSHIEATALEMALGSDPRRGAVNVIRLRHKIDNPRLLFKPPCKTP